MKEIYKPLLNNSFSRYAVSNKGNVKHRQVVTWYNRSRHNFRPEKILKPQKSNNGYLRYHLWINGHHKHVLAHRIELETFDPVNNMRDLQVNHDNEIRSDNRLSNLDWLTPSENDNYGNHNLHMSLTKQKKMAHPVYLCNKFSKSSFSSSRSASQYLLHKLHLSVKLQSVISALDKTFYHSGFKYHQYYLLRK